MTLAMTQPQHVTGLTDHEAANSPDVTLNWAQNQEPKAMFDDSSVPLFTMYCRMTEQENKKVEGWLKWVDRVIIFMGLFSAAVAVLLTVTVPDLKQNSQDLSAFYLNSIYNLQVQVLGDSNVSRPFTPAQLPQFSAPKYAIWVNTLLFMSLCLNIFAMILALLIRESVPQYLLLTESPKISLLHRARVREIVTSELYDSLAFWALRVMINLSAWFFFSGLSVYLFNINRAVFGPVFCCACLCFIACCFVAYWLVMVNMRSQSSATIDDRVLNRLFNALVLDSDLVQFFEGIPDFCRSSVVQNPLRSVTNLGKGTLHMVVKSLLERTWSSNLLSDSEKMRRLIICGNVADAIRLPNVALSILKDMFTHDWHSPLRSADLRQFLKTQGNRGRQQIGLCAQSIIAGIISHVQGSDNGWTALATYQLGAALPRYVEHGNDSVSLANLIYITRQIVHSGVGDDLDQGMAHASTFILPTLSRFDIRNALPELQRDFLILWDEIDRLGEASNKTVFTVVRDRLRNLHNALTANRRPPDSEVQQDLLGRAFNVEYNTQSADLTTPSSNGSNDTLPFVLEVRRDPLGESLGHDTPTTTWIRNLPNLAPISLHNPYSLTDVIAAGSSHTTEPADELPWPA